MATEETLENGAPCLASPPPPPQKKKNPHKGEENYRRLRTSVLDIAVHRPTIISVPAEQGREREKKKEGKHGIISV